MTAIICCYGLYDEDIRTPAEMRGLKQYWQGIVKYLDTVKNQVSTIVICGGYRQYFVNEAQSNLGLYKKTCEEMDIDLSKIPVFLETSSSSLLQNLTFGYMTVSEFGKPDGLLIFCDKVRENRVKIVSSSLFEGVVSNIQTVGIDRVDIHPHSSEEYQNETALVQDLESQEFKIFRELVKV